MNSSTEQIIFDIIAKTCSVDRDRITLDSTLKDLDVHSLDAVQVLFEIEESISSHPSVAEVAVVGVADQLKGQVAMAFVVLKDANAAATPEAALKLEGAIMKVVDEQLGAVARPSRVRFVSVLPKTRSGKLLRRAIQAVCEGRDPGDLTTIEDPTALAQIKDQAAPKA